MAYAKFALGIGSLKHSTSSSSLTSATAVRHAALDTDLTRRDTRLTRNPGSWGSLVVSRGHSNTSSDLGEHSATSIDARAWARVRLPPPPRMLRSHDRVVP